MNHVTILIYIGTIAWVLHIGLGWFQVSVFNEALSKLSTDGYVIISRSSGKLKSHAVVAISVSKEGDILDNFIIHGITVFSRPKKYEFLVGENIKLINPFTLFPKHKSIQEALSLAIDNGTGK